MKIAVFDTETTGIPKHPDSKMEVQPKAIEFGGVIVDHEGNVLHELELLFNPGEPLEAIITKITGLTDDDLKDQPTFSEQAFRVEEFFGACDAVIAHNLPFDCNIIELEYLRMEKAGFPWPKIQVCTVQENAERWGRRPKLLELYEEQFGEPLEQKHRALDDVMALVNVCRATGVFNDIHAAAQNQN